MSRTYTSSLTPLRMRHIAVCSAYGPALMAEARNMSKVLVPSLPFDFTVNDSSPFLP